MNITKEEISPVDVRLTVAIEENDYKDEVTKKLKEIGRTHVLPGFRKGHVPFGELKRRFGKQMTSDVINDTVYRAVIDYITENNLPVMGHPVPVEVKEAFEEGDQEFKYDLALIPQLDIKPSNEDHYPFYEIEVTEDMINEQDKNLRKRFGKQEPGQEMTEDGVVKGTLMQLNEDGTVNQNEGAIQVTDGIVFPLYFKDKDEAAKFAGKKPGDKVVFNPNKAAGGDAGELASMLHVDKAIAGDIKSDFEMTISEIIVSVPAELGEEYYKMVFGEDKVHNEEEYCAALKEMIAGELSQNSHILFRNQFDKAMMEKYGESMVLPAETIKKLFFADAENADEAFKAQENGIKHEIIETNLLKALEIKVEEDEVLQTAKFLTARQFAQYGMAGLDDEIITRYAKEQLEKSEIRQQLVQQVLTSKLYDAIEKAVSLDKKTVSLDEFKTIAQEA